MTRTLAGADERPELVRVPAQEPVRHSPEASQGRPGQGDVKAVLEDDLLDLRQAQVLQEPVPAGGRQAVRQSPEGLTAPASSSRGRLKPSSVSIANSRSDSAVAITASQSRRGSATSTSIPVISIASHMASRNANAFTTSTVRPKVRTMARPVNPASTGRTKVLTMASSAPSSNRSVGAAPVMSTTGTSKT